MQEETEKPVSTTKPGEFPDAETKEIVEEIEQEEKENLEEEGKKSEEKATPKSEDTPEEDESDDEEGDEDEDDEEESEDSGEESDEDDDEDEEEGEDDAPDEGKKPKPSEDTVPLSKYLNLKTKLKSVKKELSGALGNRREAHARGEGDQGDSDFNDEIKKIAEAHNTDPAFLTAFADAIKKSSLPKHLIKGVDVLLEQAEERNQDRQFRKAFKNDVMPLIEKEYPSATPEQVNKLMRKFKEVAFDENYLGVKDLTVLYRGLPQFREAIKESKKGGERTHGKSSRVAGKKGKIPDNIDFDNPDSIDWDSLSESEFDAVSEALEKKSGSRLRIVQ